MKYFKRLLYKRKKNEKIYYFVSTIQIRRCTERVWRFDHTPPFSIGE